MSLIIKRLGIAALAVGLVSVFPATGFVVGSQHASAQPGLILHARKEPSPPRGWYYYDGPFTGQYASREASIKLHYHCVTKPTMQFRVWQGNDGYWVIAFVGGGSCALEGGEGGRR